MPQTDVLLEAEADDLRLGRDFESQAQEPDDQALADLLFATVGETPNDVERLNAMARGLLWLLDRSPETRARFALLWRRVEDSGLADQGHVFQGFELPELALRIERHLDRLLAIDGWAYAWTVLDPERHGGGCHYDEMINLCRAREQRTDETSERARLAEVRERLDVERQLEAYAASCRAIERKA